MTRIFFSLALISLAGMLIAAGVGLSVGDLRGEVDVNQLRYAAMHRSLGIAAAILIVVVHALAIAYFVASSRWMREVVNTYSLDLGFVDDMDALKRRTIPISILGMLLVVIVVALGGAVAASSSKIAAANAANQSKVNGSPQRPGTSSFDNQPLRAPLNNNAQGFNSGFPANSQSGNSGFSSNNGAGGAGTTKPSTLSSPMTAGTTPAAQTPRSGTTAHLVAGLLGLALTGVFYMIEWVRIDDANRLMREATDEVRDIREEKSSGESSASERSRESNSSRESSSHRESDRRSRRSA